MEMRTLEFEVKIISIETVKPSSPTPSYLREFNLSMLDQISAPIHIGALLVYGPTSHSQRLDVACLKSSLAQALCQFYPIAGRCKDDSTITCNDQGVPLVEAHVNCSLSALLNSPHKMELLSKFQLLPPKDFLATGNKPVSELAHLAIQINVFNCGGIVFGFYMLHKIMDGSSVGTFFKDWAALASQHYEKAVQPDFHSTVTAFPPYSKEEKACERETEQATMPDYYDVSGQSGSIVVGKGFLFSNTSMNKLRTKAASKQVPNPTRFEAVVGHIWERALAAGRPSTDEPPVLAFAADMRPRTNPPLPQGSIGNLVATPVAFAKKGSNLPVLVTEIHTAILKVTEEISREFQGQNGAEAILSSRNQLLSSLLEYKAGTYILSSWCRNGLIEADFGFGNPKMIVFPVNDGLIIPSRRNFISLTDYRTDDGDEGIAAWIYLEEKEMQLLESDQEFLAFASQW